MKPTASLEADVSGDLDLTTFLSSKKIDKWFIISPQEFNSFCREGFASLRPWMVIHIEYHLQWPGQVF